VAHRGSPPVAWRWDWTALHDVALKEARAVLRDDHAAQDAAQEAALRAWRNAAACRAPGAPEAWVRTIARREALRLLRPATLTLEDDVAVADAAAAPVDEAVVLRADVGRAVGGLSEHERVVVEHHYWDDLTCVQIAEAMRVPVGTVKIRLHRARHKLRERL
jgi:RNA polymerase sigma-70 factor (ECF subfamily)